MPKRLLLCHHRSHGIRCLFDWHLLWQWRSELLCLCRREVQRYHSFIELQFLPRWKVSRLKCANKLQALPRGKCCALMFLLILFLYDLISFCSFHLIMVFRGTTAQRAPRVRRHAPVGEFDKCRNSFKW